MEGIQWELKCSENSLATLGIFCKEYLLGCFDAEKEARISLFLLRLRLAPINYTFFRSMSSRVSERMQTIWKGIAEALDSL